jgi:hypothetical protein
MICGGEWKSLAYPAQVLTDLQYFLEGRYTSSDQLWKLKFLFIIVHRKYRVYISEKSDASVLAICFLKYNKLALIKLSWYDNCNNVYIVAYTIR